MSVLSAQQVRQVAGSDSRSNTFSLSVLGALIESLPAKKLEIISRQTRPVLSNRLQNELRAEIDADEPLLLLSPGKGL